MIKKNQLFKMMSFWPPLMGAGISVDEVSPDCRLIRVSLKLSFWNKNYVNTHYGGSLYSMTDPFYMLMLMENLGRDYIVWDKAASIEFKRPGKGRVHCTFKITEEILENIKQELLKKEKIFPEFSIDVLDHNNEVIATVHKTLYVKKK